MSNLTSNEIANLPETDDLNRGENVPLFTTDENGEFVTLPRKNVNFDFSEVKKGISLPFLGVVFLDFLKIKKVQLVSFGNKIFYLKLFGFNKKHAIDYFMLEQKYGIPRKYLAL